MNTFQVVDSSADDLDTITISIVEYEFLLRSRRIVDAVIDKYDSNASFHAMGKEFVRQLTKENED